MLLDLEEGGLIGVGLAGVELAIDNVADGLGGHSVFVREFRGTALTRLPSGTDLTVPDVAEGSLDFVKVQQLTFKQHHDVECLFDRIALL